MTRPWRWGGGYLIPGPGDALGVYSLCWWEARLC